MNCFPIELWTEVASYLSPRSLKQFSLASKTCASLARPLLFKTIDVILWELDWSRFRDFMNYGTKLHHHVRRLEIHLQDVGLEASYAEELWIACIKENFDRQAQAHGWSEPERASKHQWVDQVGPKTYVTCQEEDTEQNSLLKSVLQPEIWQSILDRLENLRAICLLADGLGNECRKGRLFVEHSHGPIPRSASPRRPASWWVTGDTYNFSRFLHVTLFLFVPALSKLKHPSKLRELRFGEIAWDYGIHFQPGCSMLNEWRRVLEPIAKLSLLFTRASFSARILPESIQQSLSQNITQQIMEQAGDRLKELVLGWDYDTFGRPIACDQVAQMRFPQLEVFSVGGFSFQVELFQQFLQSHAGTLKHLELHDITLCPTDEMAPFPTEDACAASQILGNFFCWLTESLNLCDARFSGRLQVGNGNDHMSSLYSMDYECPWLLLHHREVGAIRYRHQPVGVQIGIVVSSRRPVTHLASRYHESASRKDRVRWICALMELDFKLSLTDAASASVI